VLREGIESNVAYMKKWKHKCVLYLLERKWREFAVRTTIERRGGGRGEKVSRRGG
jgi:hypothetical protein